MDLRSRSRRLCALSLVLPAFWLSPLAHAQGGDFSYFTGTTRLACEALLCLSSSAGGTTADCNPALSHYYGIKKKKLSKTLDARLNFLHQCPDVSQTPQMAALAEALAHGAGRCDAASLNSVLTTWSSMGQEGETQHISARLPDYCDAYMHQEYTNLEDAAPRYVGSEAEGGYWVEAQDYEAAQMKYQSAVEARNKALEQYNSSN